MRPFGFASYYDTYKAVLEYNLRGVADRITCPLLITEPSTKLTGLANHSNSTIW